MAGREPLHDGREDAAGAPVGVAAGLLLHLADEPRAVVAQLVLELAHEDLLRLRRAQAGHPLELADLVALGLLELLAPVIQVARAVLERALLLAELRLLQRPARSRGRAAAPRAEPARSAAPASSSSSSSRRTRARRRRPGSVRSGARERAVRPPQARAGAGRAAQPRPRPQPPRALPTGSPSPCVSLIRRAGAGSISVLSSGAAQRRETAEVAHVALPEPRLARSRSTVKLRRGVHPPVVSVSKAVRFACRSGLTAAVPAASHEGNHAPRVAGNPRRPSPSARSCSRTAPRRRAPARTRAAPGGARRGRAPRRPPRRRAPAAEQEQRASRARPSRPPARRPPRSPPAPTPRRRSSLSIRARAPALELALVRGEAPREASIVQRPLARSSSIASSIALASTRCARGAPASRRRSARAGRSPGSAHAERPLSRRAPGPSRSTARRRPLLRGLLLRRLLGRRQPSAPSRRPPAPARPPAVRRRLGPRAA